MTLIRFRNRTVETQSFRVKHTLQGWRSDKLSYLCEISTLHHFGNGSHPPELATTATYKAHCTVQKMATCTRSTSLFTSSTRTTRLMKTLFLFFFSLFLVAHLATTSGIQLHIYPANHIRHCSRTTTSDFPQEVSRPEKVTFCKQPASVRLSCSIRTNASLRRTSTQASTAGGQSCTPVASNVTATS